MVSSPAMARSVVVLPQPDWPSSTTNSLSSIVRLMSLMTWSGAEVLLDVAKLDLGHAVTFCSFWVDAVGPGFGPNQPVNMNVDQPDQHDRQPVAVEEQDPGLAERDDAEHHDDLGRR